MIRLFVVLSLSVISVPALAAELPEAFYSKKITVELRQAEVRNMYRLIGDVMATEMRIDACLQQRKLDIKLKNAPVSVVLDVMAAKLDVVHTPQPGGTAILVTCKGTAPTTAEPLAPQPGLSDVARAPAEVLDRRLSLDVKDASLQRVAALLAAAAGVKLRPMTELEGKVQPMKGKVTQKADRAKRNINGKAEEIKGRARQKTA